MSQFRQNRVKKTWRNVTTWQRGEDEKVDYDRIWVQ